MFLVGIGGSITGGILVLVGIIAVSGIGAALLAGLSTNSNEQKEKPEEQKKR